MKLWIHKEQSVVTEKKRGRDCGQSFENHQGIPDLGGVTSKIAATPDSMNCVETVNHGDKK